jgi:CRP-like cAMP-binding protein
VLQLQIVNFKQGSYIIVEGNSNNDKFYIIQKGAVQCFKSSGSGTQSYLLGAGDFVGVVPCMSGPSQIETAIA